MRNEIQKNAPFAYLNQKHSLAAYNLFIVIPVEEGYEMLDVDSEDERIQYFKGRTEINISLLKTGASTKSIVQKQFSLDPDSIPDYDFDPDSDELVIKVSVFENFDTIIAEYSSTLLFRNNDKPYVCEKEMEASRSLGPREVPSQSNRDKDKIRDMGSSKLS